MVVREFTLRLMKAADGPTVALGGFPGQMTGQKNTNTYVCEEGGKVVGMATGVECPGHDTALLKMIRSTIAGDWDVMLALMEVHAERAIATGHVYVDVRVPYVGQCTNVADTGTLVARLISDLGIEWKVEGKDTKTGLTASLTARPELKPLLERIGKLLEGRVKRTAK